MKSIRKISVKTVALKTIIYRIFIILVQAFFTFLYIKNFSKALNISIGWNVINIGLYFIYEYLFAKKWDMTIQTKGAVIWLTGLPCSGKTTIGNKLATILKRKGLNVERLDGDIVRKGKLSDDLGFSKEDRDKNINRITFVSKLLSRNKTIVIASFVSPYIYTRNNIRNNVTNFIEVYVKASSEICAKRDVKGMWAKAKKGIIKGFTGYDDPYQKPNNPEIICNTEKENLSNSVNKILVYLENKKII